METKIKYNWIRSIDVNCCGIYIPLSFHSMYASGFYQILSETNGALINILEDLAHPRSSSQIYYNNET